MKYIVIDKCELAFRDDNNELTDRIFHKGDIIDEEFASKIPQELIERMKQMQLIIEYHEEKDYIADINDDFWKIIDMKSTENEEFNENTLKNDEKNSILAQAIYDVVPFIYYRNEFYIYENGIYKRVSDEFVRKLVHDAISLINMSSKKTYISQTKYNYDEVIHLLKSYFYIDKISEELQNYIPLKNKIYDIVSKEAFSYHEKYIFFSKLNVEYDENAKECPNFMKFLDDITEGDEKKKKLILQMMAYCLYPNYKYHVFFVLTGAGANGKTTLLNFLTDLLGTENVSNRTLHELAENRFASYDLMNKFANISSELTSKDLRDTTIIKALTGGDWIVGERKFKNPVKFKNFAKLIFATNQVPKMLEDDSYGLYRRVILIPFTRTFKQEEMDTQMLEKLKSEKKAVLHILLKELHELLEKGFVYESDVDKIRETYNLHASPVEIFFDNYVTYGVRGCVFSKDIYNAYVDFCKKNKLSACSREAFIKQIRAIIKSTGGSLTAKQVRVKQVNENYNTREKMLFWIRLEDEYSIYNQDIEIYREYIE